MYQWMKLGLFSSLVILTLQSVQANDLPDFTELVKDTAPAVVNISTITHSSAVKNANQHMPQELPELFKRFFGEEMPPGNSHSPRNEPEQSSLGAGFIVSEDGYILTNYHVVKGADEIIVRLTDRRELVAELIGKDPRSDLALLKVEAENLPVVEIGSSEKLEVGEWVVAIGSPFGFDYSVTKGIVSAKGRSLPSESYVPFIQTDVAINPGNSGGPLFDLNGRVVGINSQIYTRSGGFMGLSFAIPIDVAMDVMSQLKTTGTVSRGWLGVVIQEVNQELAESVNLDKAAGALIAQLSEGGPAHLAGLQPGDIIISYNEKSIELSSDLPHIVGSTKPGDVAQIQVVRNAKRKIIHVEIGKLPSEGSEIAAVSADSNINSVLGIVVSDLTPEQVHMIGLEGVLVKNVKQGPAAQAGLVEGDVIALLNDKRTVNVAMFKQVLLSVPKGKLLPMRILREGSAMFIPLQIPH
jgi:serine protease Do